MGWLQVMFQTGVIGPIYRVSKKKIQIYVPKLTLRERVEIG